MLWAGSEPSQIYLGQTRVGVWSTSSPDVGVQWLSAESAQDGWARGIERLRQDGQPKRQRVKVWLSGALARPFVFEPVQGLRRWSEALQVAAGLAPDATGLEGPCEVWLDDWAPGKSCIAVAVDRGLRELIESSAKTEKLRLTAIRPWWAEALREVVRAEASTTGLLAVEEVDALTVLSGDGGVLAAASCYSPRPDSTQTEALLTRALMAANVMSANGRRASLREEEELGREGTSEAVAIGPVVPFGVCLEQIT